MMGVYINGMEMPESCEGCRFSIDGFCYAYGAPNIAAQRGLERTNYCPLIPVPPHGRLIDADALEYHADNVRDPMGRTEKTVMWKKIEAAPTIIEAEEGE